MTRIFKRRFIEIRFNQRCTASVLSAFQIIFVQKNKINGATT